MREAREDMRVTRAAAAKHKQAVPQAAPPQVKAEEADAEPSSDGSDEFDPEAEKPKVLLNYASPF